MMYACIHENNRGKYEEGGLPVRDPPSDATEKIVSKNLSEPETRIVSVDEDRSLIKTETLVGRSGCLICREIFL